MYKTINLNIQRRNKRKKEQFSRLCNLLCLICIFRLDVISLHLVAIIITLSQNKKENEKKKKKANGKVSAS